MSDPRSRFRLRLGIGTVLVAIAACRSTIPVDPRPVRAEAWRHYLEGQSHRWAGRFDEAAAAYEKAIASDPHLVDAHRHFQNHRMGECRRAELVERYRSLVEEHPDSAAFQYLFGRLLDDPEEQRRAFTTAVERDPSLPWGHYGLGILAQRAGKLDRAKAHYERALAAEGGHHDALVRLAEIAWKRGEGRDALALYSRASARRPLELDTRLAIARLLERSESHDPALRTALVAARNAPWSGRAASTVDDLLRRGGRLSDLPRLAETLDDLTEEEGAHPLLFLARARVAIALGDPSYAAMLLEEGLRRGGEGSDFAVVLRDARLLLGDYRGALEAWRMHVPDSLVLTDRSAYRDRYRSLIEVLSSPEPGPGGHLSRARALERVGWLDAAAHEYRMYLLREPDDEEVWALLESLTAHQRFVRRLDKGARQVYRLHTADLGAPTLGEFLDWVDEVAEETLGRPLVEGVRFDRYALVGSLMVPGFLAPSELSRQFDRYGQILVLGKQLGGPPEMFVAGVLELRTDTYVELGRADRNPPYGRVLTHDTRIPGYRESQGASIGGVAFGWWMVLAYDVIREWQETARMLAGSLGPRPESLFDLPLPPRSDGPEAVGHLDCADRKLYLRAFLEAAPGDEPFPTTSTLLLDTVEAHEYGHLLDFHRFVPFGSNFFRALGVFLQHGFRRSRVEEFLEANAQLVAMALGPSPHAALAQALVSRGDADDSPPHSRAYHRVTRQWIRYLEAHLDEFPALDGRYQLLAQLHRLSAKEIRDVARVLLERRGLRVRTRPCGAR